MKFIVSFLKLSVIILPFVFFVRFITSEQNEEDRLIISKWKYTVGEIVKTKSRKSGQFAIARFSVDGKVYHEEFSFRNGIIGNCYTVYYDSINPERMSVLDQGSQRLISHFNNIEIAAFSVDVNSDTTPMGLHLIKYRYSYEDKTFNGNKYIKHKYYFDANKDSLKVIINKSTPSASFLVWPFEPTRLCVIKDGNLIPFLDGY